MLRVRIPIPRELHAPATYLKEFDEEGEFWSVLKPEIAECIKRRLPEGTVATEGQDTNYFTFPTGERVFVSWRPNLRKMPSPMMLSWAPLSLTPSRYPMPCYNVFPSH